MREREALPQIAAILILQMAHSVYMRFLLFCLCLFAGTIQTGHAQHLPPDLDSLKQVARHGDNPLERARSFNFLSQVFSTSSLDSSLVFSKNALNLVHRHQLDTLRTDVYNTLAIIYIKRGQLDEGMTYLDSVIVVGEAQQNASAQLSANINLAALHYQLGDYEHALLHNLKALKIAEQEKDTLGMASVHLNICGIHFIRRDYEESKKSALQSLSFSRAKNRPYRIGQALLNLGTVHVKLNDFVKVKQYAEEALSIALEIGDSETEGDALGLLAKHASEIGKHEDALSYSTQSLELLEKVGNLLKITEVSVERAKALQNLQRFDEAREAFETTLSMASQLGAGHLKRDAMEGLMKISAAKGNYADAWAYSQRYIALQDSLINEENLRQINTLSKQFESEKQAAEIARLETENELQSAQIKQKEAEAWFRNLLVVSLALVLILVLLTGYFVRRQNQLKQRQKSAELEHRALRNQMNPHFIFNCLNSLQRLYVEGKRAEANEYMGDFADLLRKILENSNKSSITLHEELATLRLYMELERARSPNEITYEVEVDERIDPQQFSVPPLILQPFVENAIWHGILPAKKPGHIRIRVLPSNGGYRFEVEDNGVGFSETEKRTGESHGIRITAQRIGSRVSIERIDEGGTRVSFTLKSAA